MSHPDADWLLRYLDPLEGATIVMVGVKEDEDGAWPTFTVQTKAGERFELEVSRDEEGNGPGFLFGLPFPLTAV